MSNTLNENLNIVSDSNLEIELMGDDLVIIQKLDDEPNDVGGMTSSELKATFDKAGLLIQKYINEKLIPAILADDATEAARAAAELVREASERQRVSNEQERVTNEQERISNEENRVNAESGRSQAEGNRVYAEAARAEAERRRTDSTNGIVAQATAKASEAATSAANAKASETSAASSAGAAKASESNAKYSENAARTAKTDAEAAKRDAEKARDEAQNIVGGDFATKTEAQTYANTAESNANAYTNQKIAAIPTPDVSGQINTHNTATDAHSDIRQLIANKKGAQVYTATIGTTWTEDGNTGVKTQTVAISGVTADQTAKVDHAYTGDGASGDYFTFVEEENQYLDYITNGFAETVAGGIKFTIFGDANTVSIPIVVEVV